MVAGIAAGELIEAHVLKLLKETSEKGLSVLTKELRELGADPKRAHSMAKALRTSLRRGGSYDDPMKEALEDAITHRFTKLISDGAEGSFKETMQKGLRGELDSKAGREMAEALREKGIKLAQKEIDDLTEAAWKGAREGIERGVRKVVRHAIDEAFRKFRAAPRVQPRLRGREQAGNHETASGGVGGDGSAKEAVKPERVTQWHAEVKGYEQRRIFSRMRNTSAGMERDIFVTDDSGNEVLLGSQMVEAGAKERAKKAA